MSLKIAKKFFAYVAKQFPVMCASGAFPMLPPVTDSSKWMDRLDDLSQKGIAKHVATLTQYKANFLNAAAKAASQEEEAQAQALALSASGAITELDQVRAWEKMPELYLSVAFTGLEQAADLPAKSTKVLQKRFMKRLREIPGLLEQGTNNIEAISSSSRATSQTMIRDCARYLTNLGNSELGLVGKTPKFLADALASLKEYDRFVTTRPEVMDNQGPSFAYLAEHVYGTDKTPEQILTIAEEEWDCRQASLAWFESEIGQGKGWRELYDQYAGPVIDDMDALDVVIREIHRLRNFVLETALPNVFTNTGLRIEPQPLHMASTLRPIHHDPALGAWENEPSRCYVSPQIFSGRGFRDNPMQLARARKEFPFSVASQTYPGRHLLDSQRLSLGGSPLSQVTNPLFMAGWLAFAENLLDELGYLEFPLDRLVHHKRGLARAGLALVDAGLATETMDQTRCLSILKTAGYSTTEALNHILSIRLAPAERAMPILGLHEITALRKTSKMDIGPFCTALFAGGQLPFHLIRRQMGF